MRARATIFAMVREAGASIMRGMSQKHFVTAGIALAAAGAGYFLGAMGGGKGAPGTSLHAAVFRGIDNAAEIKALIQERLRALKDSGLGDLDDHRAEHPAPDAALLAALREVHAEAAALRAAAAR